MTQPQPIARSPIFVLTEKEFAGHQRYQTRKTRLFLLLIGPAYAILDFLSSVSLWGGNLSDVWRYSYASNAEILRMFLLLVGAPLFVLNVPNIIARKHARIPLNQRPRAVVLAPAALLVEGDGFAIRYAWDLVGAFHETGDLMMIQIGRDSAHQFAVLVPRSAFATLAEYGTFRSVLRERIDKALPNADELTKI